MMLRVVEMVRIVVVGIVSRFKRGRRKERCVIMMGRLGMVDRCEEMVFEMRLGGWLCIVWVVCCFLWMSNG